MTIREIFDNLLHGRGQQLSWGWLADDHLDASVNATPFAARQNYFVVRLSEMYLKDTRVLWKKYYPMVQAYVDHGDQHATAVAGPGQLKDLGSINLDRLIGLAYPLCPVTVYQGVDLSFLVGLYSVESQDAAKVLLASLGQLAGLAGVGADVALRIADVVKSGVEGVLQLNGTTLQLGARDSLLPGAGGKIAKAGFLLAVNAPNGLVDYNRLWVKEGRLMQGSAPPTATAYADHDYMLIQIERRDLREDWASLTEIQKHEPDIDTALRSGAAVTEIVKTLNGIWTALRLDVKASMNLTEPDKSRVLAGLQADLQSKIDSLKTGGPFELKGLLAEAARGGRKDAAFDLLGVSDAFTGKSAGEIGALTAALDRPLA